eukprot:Em0020g369a
MASEPPQDAPPPVAPTPAEAQAPPARDTSTTETASTGSTVRSTADMKTVEGGNPNQISHQTQEVAQERSQPPSPIQAIRPIQDIKAPRSTITNLNQPYGIAVNSKGEIVVAELGAKCISVFNPEGHKLRSFGTDKFRGCKRVAVDHEDNVLVTDHSHHRPQVHFRWCLCRVCGQEGRSISAVQLPGRNQGPPRNKEHLRLRPNQPQAMVEGNSTVPWTLHSTTMATCMCRISRITGFRFSLQKGELQRNIGKSGAGSGELYLPSGLHVDSSHIYVAEEANNRISVFTTDGMFIGSFGTQDGGGKVLKQPIAVAVDVNGLVYVSDHSNNCVHVF